MRKRHAGPYALRMHQNAELFGHEGGAYARHQPILKPQVADKPAQESFGCRHHPEPKFAPPPEALWHAGFLQGTIRSDPKPEESRDGGLGIQPLPGPLELPSNHRISNECFLERIAKKSDLAAQAVWSPPPAQDLVFLVLKLLRNATSKSNRREWHHQNRGVPSKPPLRFRTTGELATLPRSWPNTVNSSGNSEVL